MILGISDPKIVEFCENLSKLDAGEKARLKRNAGRTLAQSRRVMGLFFNRLLPYGVPGYQEGKYFLVATLYPLADSGGAGSLGASLRRAKEHDSLDRRVEILLDADDAHLPFRLRQTLRFLYSKRQPVNWPLLLRDLLAWNSEKRWVQEQWARDYFVGPKEEKSGNS
jgi:CRISPR system Cascade subunit CasB